MSVPQDPMISFTAYRCYKCNRGFGKLTNTEPENRIACFYGDCEGWMYPVEIEEPKPTRPPLLLYVLLAILFYLIVSSFAESFASGMRSLGFALVGSILGIIWSILE